MGGFIALTVRYSDGQEYRGSCWTNVLPEGLFGHEFYFKDKSEAHTRKWLNNILEGRRKEPELEKMWGGWNKLVPDGYGIVLVDYKTGTVISANGYTDPLSIYTFVDPAKIGKFIRLHEAGLLEGIEIQRASRGEKDRFGFATEEEIRGFIEKTADLVYLDPEEGWMFSKPQSYEGTDKIPLLIAKIKLWLPNVVVFDREKGFEKKWAETYRWVGENFDLSKAEKRAWDKWIREEVRV